MRAMKYRLVSSLSLLVLVACEETVVPTDGGPVYDPYAAACEGLDPTMCILPWPSSRYLEEDPTTATGFRVSIPIEATPRNRRRVSVDPAQFERFDGFSPFTSMITAFPHDIDPAGLPDERHIGDSLLPTSPTVLLEIGEDGSVTRVAHFAEVDTWPEARPDERPFYIRPAARLRPATRYVVAIRNLDYMDGTSVEPSPYFGALRDNTPFDQAPDLEGRRARFAEIFGFLEDADVARAELVLAWDFVTASDELIYSDLITARDRAHEALDESGVSCTIERTDTSPSPEIARRMVGTFRVPLFINGEDPTSVEESSLHRDASGAPISTTTAEIPFVAAISTTVYDRIRDGSGGAGRLMAYGHGLFGSRFEGAGGDQPTDGASGWFNELVDELGLVTIATDWWGMSENDVTRVTLTLNEFSSFSSTGERLVQGMVNLEVMMRSFREVCIGEPATENPFYVVPEAGGEPVLAYDPGDRYYYGNSQGGIMGLTFAGMSLEVDRFVAGVPGVAYSVMIPRSSNWQTYGVIMRNGYPRFIDGATLMTMSQSLWDLADPSTFVGHITHDPLPCSLDETRCPGGLTPTHDVMFHIGVDDPQVANITADMAVRTAGVPVVTPSPYLPYGVPTTDVAVPSGMVIFEIPGAPVLPIGTRDPGSEDGEDAHSGPRRAASGRAMIDAFFHPDGVVASTCDGPCNPD